MTKLADPLSPPPALPSGQLPGAAFFVPGRRIHGSNLHERETITPASPFSEFQNFFRSYDEIKSAGKRPSAMAPAPSKAKSSDRAAGYSSAGM
jgi:hypothetical protein